MARFDAYTAYPSPLQLPGIATDGVSAGDPLPSRVAFDPALSGVRMSFYRYKLLFCL